jgi:nucleoside-diphosphate-sugar epimerase
MNVCPEGAQGHILGARPAGVEIILTPLITGASGFVGQALCRRLPDARAVTRRGDAASGFVVPAIDDATDWSGAFDGVQAVIHLAARVHVMDEQAADPLAEFRRVNTAGTLNLARQAAAAGVRRFVFASSVKVNGESTQPGRPFTADDVPAPEDPYGISKAEAEQGLHEVAAQTGMEVAIIRPPLVYGPGVKANFASMMRWLARGVPLPLGAITENRRSLVALDNLVDLLCVCLDHPAAANQTFMAGDGEDLSTTALLTRMGKAMGHPARLLPVPPALLSLGAGMLGRKTFAQRLLGSLQIDIGKTTALLGWTPPVSVDEALRRAAAGDV